MKIEGFCDERFASVRDEFEKNFTERGDTGACFALTLEGEYVVDIWAGHQDKALKKLWQEDTIINVFSSTKTMTFLCALVLADRGLLNFEACVADYWPEFSAGNKTQIKVKHLMSHSAGLPGFSRRFTTPELCDWNFCCDDLANQSPWWEPGTQSGYHAITQGYLIGEVIRRITDRTIGQFFKSDIADLVGADFQISVDPNDFPRIADLIEAKEIAPILEMDPNSIPGRVFADMEDDVVEMTTSVEWKQAEIPAANGHGNARSIVRAQTASANGGSAFGVELLSADGCSKALESQTNGNDLVLGIPVNFAMGYALANETIPISPNSNTLWWGGAGGSTVVVDTDAHACFSYLMNQMDNNIVGDPRGAALGAAVYSSLGDQ
ncbi:MAG TPA: class A beta-lactamase-related serine hydrolase [Pseudomonadales bacterium]|nr:class A beta-lactamase-related serine hydrolase [Gammaproteobacteria bacterium]HIL84816.1 class A beta-lactamase-related serine hydrolase [Pseudomonadales bacterium]